MYSPAGGQISARTSWLILLAILLAGTGLRAFSYHWNTDLNGDVNLFALTAREYSTSGQLDYPMKYEYSDLVSYPARHTPASQHPPLWPLLGGFISRLLASLDTFTVLKGMSLVAGLLLLGLAFAGLQRIAPVEALAATAMLSFSAVLADYSANASPYILVAFFLLATAYLLIHFRRERLWDYALAGVLCALGILTHSILALLPVVFLAAWLSRHWRGAWQGVAIFLVILLGMLAPWMAWNQIHFGRLLYSSTTNYTLERLGLWKVGLYNGIITGRMVESLPGLPTLAGRYALLAAKAGLASFNHLVMIVGPFGLLLAGIGIIALFRQRSAWLAALLLPTGLYTLTIFLWAAYKFRFLIPILPAIGVLAAFGFSAWIATNHTTPNRLGYARIRQWSGWICLAGALIWGIGIYIQMGPQLYFGDEGRSHAALYAYMHPLADELQKQPPGTVLGYAQVLDGGIETVYWTGFPFVAGRDLKTDEIQILARDFGVRYIWADEDTLPTAQLAFPGAQIILSNPPFYVLEKFSP